MDTGDGACAFIATNSHPLDVSSGNGDASAGAAKIDDERVGLEQRQRTMRTMEKVQTQSERVSHVETAMTME